MSTNKRKEELLNNKFQLYLDEDESHEEIEMANFKALNNKGANYTKLQDEGNQSNLFHPRKNHQPVNIHEQQMIFADKPVTPVTSYNFEPNNITMNGTTFVHKDTIKGMARTQAKPKKPEMQVECNNCCSLQMVPANTHSFVCFGCDITQGCNPQFGIFVCGCCQRKVWYPRGTSSFIKCTKCGTVNNIPLECDYHQGNHHQNVYVQRQRNDRANGANNQLNEKYFTQRHPM